MSLDKEAFEKHLNERWKTMVCPMCGRNEWTYDDTIMTPLSIGPGTEIHLGGKIVPLVPVTCVYCGNTVFVNTKIAKAFIDDREQQSNHKAES